MNIKPFTFFTPTNVKIRVEADEKSVRFTRKINRYETKVIVTAYNMTQFVENYNSLRGL